MRNMNTTRSIKKKHKETSVAELKISQNKGYKSVDFFLFY